MSAKREHAHSPCVALLVLGRKRPGFDPDWAAAMVTKVEKSLAGMPFHVMRPQTPIVDDASLRLALDECVRHGAAAAIVLQPTMSDGNIALALPQLWDGPMVLWATPEKPTGAMISSCSLVGAHAFASTFRQLGVPFELVYGMPGEAPTEQKVLTALRLVIAREAIQDSKIGLIGAHAPGFVDMVSEPFDMYRQFGLQLRHMGLPELQAMMQTPTQGEVEQDVTRARDLGLPVQDVTDAEFRTASRYYLGLRALITDESFDALAVRCWPELPNTVGQWPYLSFTRLATEGFSLACEGDVDGALACLAATHLGLGQSALFDWLEHDSDSITLWHAGCAPLGLCKAIGNDGGPRIARHFNNGKAMVVEAALREDMPVTMLRFWRCDGQYLMTAFEGTTMTPRRHLMGTYGRVRLDGGDAEGLLQELCHAGMPHHLIVVKGHHADMLGRFARLLDVERV